MKIGFICGFFHEKNRMSFGPYPLIYNIVKGIAREHDSFVLASGWPKKPMEDRVDGLKIYRVPSLELGIGKENQLGLASGFLKVWREKPDVINSQGFDGALLFTLLNLLGNKTIKITSVKSLIEARLAKSPKEEYSLKDKLLIWFQKHWEKLAIANSDYFVVQSNYAKKELMQLMQVPSNKIRMIYNGVDTKLFKPMKVKKEKAPVLFFGGGENERKGASLFFKAFAGLKKEFPGLKAIVIGSKKLEKFNELFKANKIRLEKDIQAFERVPYSEMPLWINKADIVVVPSYHETFGTINAEAMACGKPVVASDSTSLPEVLGNAGLLFRTGDEKDLQMQLKKLIGGKKLRQALGRKGIKRVKEKFDLKKTIDDYLEFFNKVAGGKKRKIFKV